MEDKFILDACCSARQFWYNKNHPNTTYIDIRDEDKGCMKSRPNFSVRPDIVMDFRKMDFPDNSFKLIVFDPPHMLTLGKTSMFRKRYGCLNAETWQSDLKKGFNECWRVLEDYGTLIFKWNDTEIPLKEVLKQFPKEPLFGSTLRNTRNQSYWLCFMKIPTKSEVISLSLFLYHLLLL